MAMWRLTCALVALAIALAGNVPLAGAGFGEQEDCVFVTDTPPAPREPTQTGQFPEPPPQYPPRPPPTRYLEISIRYAACDDVPREAIDLVCAVLSSNVTWLACPMVALATPGTPAQTSGPKKLIDEEQGLWLVGTGVCVRFGLWDDGYYEYDVDLEHSCSDAPPTSLE